MPEFFYIKLSFHGRRHLVLQREITPLDSGTGKNKSREQRPESRTNTIIQYNTNFI